MTRPPGGDLVDLEEALEQSLAVPLSCLSAVELAQRAIDLERLAARFEGLRCSTLAAASHAVEGPGAFKALGFRHAIDLVVGATKADPKVLRRLAKLGHWLIDFPTFTRAFAAGDLSERHVWELHKLDNHRVHNQLVESQEMLVAAAGDWDFSDFVNVLAYWLNAADPDGVEPSEQAARTTCSYRKHADGSVTGRFCFDALTGQAFRHPPQTRCHRLRRRPIPPDRVRHGVSTDRCGGHSSIIPTLDATSPVGRSPGTMSDTRLRCTLRLASGRPRGSPLPGRTDQVVERSDPLRPPQQEEARRGVIPSAAPLKAARPDS